MALAPFAPRIPAGLQQTLNAATTINTPMQEPFANNTATQPEWFADQSQVMQAAGGSVFGNPATSAPANPAAVTGGVWAVAKAAEEAYSSALRQAGMSVFGGMGSLPSNYTFTPPADNGGGFGGLMGRLGPAADFLGGAAKTVLNSPMIYSTSTVGGGGGPTQVRTVEDSITPIPAVERFQEGVERRLDRVPYIGPGLGLASEFVIPTSPLEIALSPTGYGLAGDVADVGRLGRGAASLSRQGVEAAARRTGQGLGSELGAIRVPGGAPDGMEPIATRKWVSMADGTPKENTYFLQKVRDLPQEQKDWFYRHNADQMFKAGGEDAFVVRRSANGVVDETYFTDPMSREDALRQAAEEVKGSSHMQDLQVEWHGRAGKTAQDRQASAAAEAQAKRESEAKFDADRRRIANEDASRYHALVADMGKGGKKTQTNVAYESGPQTREAWDVGVPGLKVFNASSDPNPKYAQWRINHDATGLMVADGFKTRAEATAAARAIGNVTDWTAKAPSGTGDAKAFLDAFRKGALPEEFDTLARRAPGVSQPPASVAADAPPSNKMSPEAVSAIRRRTKGGAEIPVTQDPMATRGAKQATAPASPAAPPTPKGRNKPVPAATDDYLAQLEASVANPDLVKARAAAAKGTQAIPLKGVRLNVAESIEKAQGRPLTEAELVKIENAKPGKLRQMQEQVEAAKDMGIQPRNMNRLLEEMGHPPNKPPVRPTATAGGTPPKGPRGLSAGKLEPAPTRGGQMVLDNIMREAKFEGTPLRDEARAFLQQVSDSPVEEVGNAMRQLAAGLDVSNALRQGALTLRHGREYLRSVASAYKALGNESYAMNRMLKLKAKDRKSLFLSQLPGERVDSTARSLSRREENYASNLIGNLPGYKQTGRANTLFLNEQRAAIYDTIEEAWEKSGWFNSKFAREGDREALANYINRATGRGTLGPFEESGVGDVLGLGFFSPRYLASRPEALMNLFNVKHPRVAVEAWKDFGVYVGGVAALLGLAKESGAADVELDPTKADFGKFRVGKVTVDPFAGFQQIARFAARMQTGAWEGDYVAVGQELERFMRTKLAPLPGTVYSLIDGKDMIGEAVTPGSLAVSLAPIFSQGIIESAIDGETGDLVREKLPAAALDAVGLGTQVYENVALRRDELASQLHDSTYSELSPMKQAEVNAKLIESGVDLEASSRRGPWWSARDAALEIVGAENPIVAKFGSYEDWENFWNDQFEAEGLPEPNWASELSKINNRAGITDWMQDLRTLAVLEDPGMVAALTEGGYSVPKYISEALKEAKSTP